MDSELLKSAKTYLVVEGLLALGLGLIILLWPGLSVATIILFIGWYGVIHGIVLFFEGAFAHKGTSDRGLGVVMGILSVIFGLLVLNVPVFFAAFYLFFIAAMIGVQGIYYMVAAFTSEESKGHKVMLFIAGILALLFSFWTIFINPINSGRILVFLLSVMMLLSGAVLVAAGTSIKTK
ncbi:MAG: DUF308 domain-containing protein [bacterium]